MPYLEDYGVPENRGFAATNLVSLLRERANRQAEATAFLFLKDGETEQARLSFAALDRRARAIAARLQALAPAGARALLVYPSGLEFIEAFFGCLYAGIVAVPVHLPSRRQAARLAAVAADAAPDLILGLAETGGNFRDELARQSGAHWVATDLLGDGSAESWTPPDLSPESLAFLQYTSGSTGDPKGVMVSHGNLLANQEAIRRSFGHTERCTVVGWLPLHHDMGLIGNVLQPLYLGSLAVLMPPLAFLEKPARWLRAISTYRATTSGGPNFAYDLCVRKLSETDKRNLDLSSWTLAFNGSEPVRTATLERFAEAFEPCGFRRESLFPCYGLAEATLFVTGGRLEAGDWRADAAPAARPAVPCGRTAEGHALLIVDPETRRPCPEGRAGEIWVVGPSVALGYRNRPEESEQLFRAVPAGCESPAAYLRTGDLGFLDDGRLHVTGRIKDLIIIRGRNIHPEDIEHALLEGVEALQPGGCAAFSLDDGDEERLAVVAELRRGAARLGEFGAIFGELRRILAEELDLAAAELILVAPGGVPKTSSGKVRRRACKQALREGSLPVLGRSGIASATPAGPAPAAAGADSLLREALASLPPARRTPLIARLLRERIAQLAGIDPARLSDAASLRSLGLDSLKTVELKHTVETLLGLDVPLSLLLSDCSIGEAALALSRDREQGDGESPISSLPELPAVDTASPAYPLAFPQKAMWTVQHLDPGSLVYNLHLALRIAGGIDEDLLRSAFGRLLERHAQLRTVYRATDEEVRQEALPAGRQDPFSAVEAGTWTEAALQADMGARVREPFDLAAGPVFRAVLYRHGEAAGDGTHTLLLCAHHIALDLWSLLILLGELRETYAALAAGREPSLPRLTPGYRDFVAWQAEYLAGEASVRAWDFWRGRLSGELPILALPTDRPRPKTSDCRGASVAIRLSGEESRKLKAVANHHGTTLFALLLAAYKVLLHRHTQQKDLIVGIPTSGRSRSAFAPVVGNFVNPVPLRTRPSADRPFSAYLAEVREALLGALEHQDFPFPLMVERLQPERSADHWPIYQTLFVLQQAQAGAEGDFAPWALGEDGPPLPFAEGSVRSLAVEQRAERFDLKLMAAECRGELLLSFQYRTELFEEPTIRRLAGHFRNLLAGITAAPDTRLGDLPLLGSEERTRLLVEWNRTERAWEDDACLHRLFEAQAERTPEAPAVLSGGQTLSYRELNARAERWARRLLAHGVRPGARVGLCVERSLDLPLGILAVFKAGAAYVPLDPAYPAERIAGLMEDAGIRVLLTQTTVWEGRPAPADGVRLAMDIPWDDSAGRPASAPLPEIPADQLAYVIYTSGSTGSPKGVAISHRSLVNYTRSVAEQIPAVPGLHYALVSTPAADLGHTVLFASLISGGCLHVLDYDTTTDGRSLADYVARHPIDVMKIVPSHVAALLDSAEGRNILPRQTLVCGGDILHRSLVRRVAELRPECRLINHYGPTETTVGSLTFAVSEDEDRASVPIGRPLANTRAYLLDANLEPVPVGVAGELHLGGLGLAQGYWNRPDLTAERFIPDPFGQGSRLYRTGDLARRDAEGVVEFLGRADHQLKIRGFRIEPGEIEARLRTHPQVSQAAVAAFEDPPGTRRLAAYVVAAGTPPEEDGLRAHLRETLPDYMVPSAFVFLEALPLTPNGKLDRAALPKPDPSARAIHRYDPPETATETLLAGLWAEVLRVERVGRHDNFFSLGGDSILSIQMASRARRAGLNLSPRQIFQHQTVAELALVAETETRYEAEQGPIEGPTPLTPVQLKFLSRNLANPHHWNQALLLELLHPLDPRWVESAVAHLVRYHDILRLRFGRDGGAWSAAYAEDSGEKVWHREDLSAVADGELEAALAERAADWQQRIDLHEGPLLRMVWFDLGRGRGTRLLLIIHHLAMDIASWRILLDDLVSIHADLAAGRPATLPPKTTSYRQWALRLRDYAAALPAESAPPLEAPALPVDHPGGGNTEADARVHPVELSAELTRAFVQDAGAAYRTSAQELLLIALAEGIAEWTGRPRCVVEVEAHSRDDDRFRDLDFTRTVGRFTTAYPVAFEFDPASPVEHRIKALKEQFRRQAALAFDHTVRRWLKGSPDAEPSESAPLLFNYLGHLDLGTDAHAHFRQCELPAGITHDPRNRRTHELAVNAAVSGGRLRLSWVYSQARYSEATIARLGETVRRALEALIAHCLEAPGGLTPSDFPLAKLAGAELDRLPYPPRNIEDLYPLGPMQEGMLFYALMYPGSGIYHMIDRYEIDGEVDLEAFRAAWQEVLDRHPILRTAFLWRDYSAPHQCVQKHLPLPFTYRDWRGLPASEQERRFEAAIAAELKNGFDFAAAPLMRIHLYRFGERRYRFVRSHHHILMDAWCKSPVLLEFRANYEAKLRGEPAPFRETAIPYRDYIAWLAKQDVAAAEAFWRRYLAGLGEPTPLVVDKPAAADAGQTSEVRDLVTHLSEADTLALHTLSQRHQLTPNTFLQAAWALMLAYYSGSREVLFGVTVAGRPTELPGVETALGLFINSLPLRVVVDPQQPALEFLRGLLYHNLELRQYEFLPLVRIQALSGLPMGQLLFQHLFVFENAPVDPTLRGERDVLNIVDDQHRTHSNYPINAVLVPGPRFHLQITYDVNRVEEAAARRMLGHFRTLLENLIHTPEVRLGALPAMLTPAESSLALTQWNRTDREYAEPREVVARFQAQATAAPERVAVACLGQALSYGELNRRANRVAHALRARGAGPETLIALLNDRGIDFLVMMLGVFKSGAAYLPLDPAHPDGRLAQVLAESRAPRLLAGESYRYRTEALCRELAPPPALDHLADLEAEAHPAADPVPRHGPENLAFTIFTSGSTGTPKGAMVEHRGMFNNLITKVPTLELTEADVIAQTAGQCFDISVWQHLTALVCGARVEIFPDEVVRDPYRLLLQLAARGVTVLEAVPSMVQAILELAGDIELPALRWLVACGEVFPPELCRRWMERFPGVRVLNAYGPAECSDDVTYYEARDLPTPADTLVAIGHPVDNTRIYLLDPWLSPVPVGVPGEICVGGIQVGRGYLHRPELTAEKFVPNPFGAAAGDGGSAPAEAAGTELRLYRTGDLGRYREDGTLEFLGRVDHQVKIRGVRIEPGEIEAQILLYPGVAQTLVMARGDGAGGKRLVAYLVREAGAAESDPGFLDGLRQHLSAALPNTMMPGAFVLLDAMPLGRNGKIDRKVLPEPDMSTQGNRDFLPPQNPTQEILAGIWKEVLGLDRVGIRDNFFERGGHSLLAVQVLSRIRQCFGLEIPLRRVFEAATIEALEQVVEEVLTEQLENLSDEEAEALLAEAQGGLPDTVFSGFQARE